MIEDTGINRNIMECKDMSTDSLNVDARSINRNIMECKGDGITD